MFCTDQDELHMIMESLMDLAEENADNDLYITEIYKAVLNLLNNEWLKPQDFLHIVGTLPTILYDALEQDIQSLEVIKVVFEHYPQYLFNNEYELNSSLLYLMMMYNLTDEQKYAIIRDSLENYVNSRHLLAVFRKYNEVPRALYESIKAFCNTVPDKKLKSKLIKAFRNVNITECRDTREDYKTFH